MGDLQVLKQFWAGHRKVVVASSVAVLVVILGGGTLMMVSGGQTSPTASPIAVASATPTATPTATETATETPTAEPTPTPTLDPNPTPIPAGWTYSDLDGVAAPANLAHRLPVALMVDDNIIARPQSGFSGASIVIQAPADGGEDRYEMIFQEGAADDIGPIRSARPYFVYWAAELVYALCGCSRVVIR